MMVKGQEHQGTTASAAAIKASNSTIDNNTTKASPTKHGGKHSSCTISDSTSKGIRGCTATHRQPRPRALASCHGRFPRRLLVAALFAASRKAGLILVAAEKEDVGSCLASAGGERCDSNRDCAGVSFGDDRSCLAAAVPWHTPHARVKCCFRCCLAYWQRELGLGRLKEVNVHICYVCVAAVGSWLTSPKLTHVRAADRRRCAHPPVLRTGRRTYGPTRCRTRRA